MTAFRYVDDPHACAPLAEPGTPCALCGALGDAYEGYHFSSVDDEPGPVCFGCLERGLPDGLLMARSGDLAALRAQLGERHADWTAAMIEADVQAKREQLERRTPPILSWQEWSWPACCGDFCRFLRHAGRRELDELAHHRDLPDGRALLAASLVDEPRPELWDWLPAEPVGVHSNDSPQAYVFECLSCQHLRITWDSH